MINEAVINILETASGFIKNERNWYKANKNRVRKTQQHCIVTAINLAQDRHVYAKGTRAYERRKIRTAVAMNLIQSLSPPFNRVYQTNYANLCRILIDWNDEKQRTFEEIKSLFTDAIKLAKQEQ